MRPNAISQPHLVDCLCHKSSFNCLLQVAASTLQPEQRHGCMFLSTSAAKARRRQAREAHNHTSARGCALFTAAHQINCNQVERQHPLVGGTPDRLERLIVSDPATQKRRYWVEGEPHQDYYCV